VKRLVGESEVGQVAGMSKSEKKCPLNYFSTSSGRALDRKGKIQA
jgi:hypothetical protein